MPLPIFYINLASRADRRQHVERQLVALGLTASRIEAVTAADCGDIAGSPLSPAELGCSRSHQKIWRLMVEQDIAAALILEDDVLLSTQLPSVLDDPNLLDGVDAIQMETRQTSAMVGRLVPGKAIGIGRGRLMSSSMGSAAYVMTKALAMRLLAHPQVNSLPLDTLLFGRPGSLFYEARIFQSVPALAIQLDQTVDGRQGAGRSDLDDRRGMFSSRDPRSTEPAWRRALHHWSHHLRLVATFATTGELWGARQYRLPVADDLRKLM
ncbi:MAG TPA: glycosyltransferase family 25 protein [Devosia sp.]|jgi:glycosyl transferase family 25|uniref:glycosyltransferase family 25 protein n=1 Tax=Devosia sp. TaxID=1871048 RepID=UPI002DDCA056|nr:glycosyltransferase family 25 protein [Devosia sp.]HEV2518562.1 glycosyltransferase family 25 protein [Devosia sp.]